MPPMSRLDVHQHLIVDGVRQTGSSVRVEVADRDGNRHWISFRFSDVAPASQHAARLSGEALFPAQLDDVQRVRKTKNSRARKIVQELKESLDRFTDLCGIEQ